MTFDKKTTTRKQLQGYGATCYQSKALTQALSPVSRQGRAYAYAVSDVIVSIREYLQRPRLKLATRHNLEAMLETLLEQLGNIVTMPLGNSTNLEISTLARQLIQAMANTDKTLTELKATAATIKGKYGV